MPLSYAIDETARLVSLRYDGAVSSREFADAMTAVFADRRFRPGFSFLADRRLAVVPSAAYAQYVVEFLVRHADAFGCSRWATVVASPAAYGMVRMMQGLSDELPVKIRAFTDLAEAIEWLGTEPAESN